MPKHLMLPNTAIDDVAPFVRLGGEQLVALAECFSSAESISPTSAEFIEKVATRLQIDSELAQSFVLVGQFLLTVVEEGNPANEVLDDVREFIAKHATTPQDEDLLPVFDAKRGILEMLLGPKLERAKALKVRYLRELFPTVDSFRTICELRPVFEGPSGQETIVGYVPVVLLEVKTSDLEGDESTIHLHLSPRKINALEDVIKRAKTKLTVLQQKFGNELLGDNVEE